MPDIAPSIAAYLDTVPDRFRPALLDMRAAILAELDQRGIAWTEDISYAMPAVRVGTKGKVVAGYAGFVRQCGLYPHSGTVLPQMRDLIGTRGGTKSALHFTPDDPIPATVLARMITLRLAEIGPT